MSGAAGKCPVMDRQASISNFRRKSGSFNVEAHIRSATSKKSALNQEESDDEDDSQGEQRMPSSNSIPSNASRLTEQRRKSTDAVPMSKIQSITMQRRKSAELTKDIYQNDTIRSALLKKEAADRGHDNIKTWCEEASDLQDAFFKTATVGSKVRRPPQKSRTFCEGSNLRRGFTKEALPKKTPKELLLEDFHATGSRDGLTSSSDSSEGSRDRTDDCQVANVTPPTYSSSGSRKPSRPGAHQPRARNKLEGDQVAPVTPLTNSSSSSRKPSRPGAHQPRAPTKLEDNLFEFAVIGKKVSVHGLASKPELNGSRGVVKHFDIAADRYTIELAGSLGTFKFNASNLSSVEGDSMTVMSFTMPHTLEASNDACHDSNKLGTKSCEYSLMSDNVVSGTVLGFSKNEVYIKQDLSGEDVQICLGCLSKQKLGRTSCNFCGARLSPKVEEKAESPACKTVVETITDVRKSRSSSRMASLMGRLVGVISSAR